MSDRSLYNAKLRNKRVLLLGGSSGVGFAVAEASVESGAEVIIASSNQSNVDKAIARILDHYPSAKGRVTGTTIDLYEEDPEPSIKALFERIGELDHIVFTASGPMAMIPFDQINVQQMAESMRVRLFGGILVARYGSKVLKKSHESSITYTSGMPHERNFDKGWAWNAVQTAALSTMPRSLALEYAPIRVNTVSLGPVWTELFQKFPAALRDHWVNTMPTKLPIGTFPQPEAVAEAYLYFMKDNSVTGTDVTTDGGYRTTI